MNEERDEIRDEDEDATVKKNNDWWRLEKFQIGRRKFA